MFTVKDLTPGMLVKLAGGDYGICIPLSKGLGIIGISDERMSILTSHIKFFPEYYTCSLYSVVEVYDVACNNAVDFFLPGDRKCLWKYDNRKEMTIEEIEKELGHPIKIVKEH